jgi:hypothetical protein
LKLGWREINEFCLAWNSKREKYRKELKTQQLKEKEVYEIFFRKQ